MWKSEPTNTSKIVSGWSVCFWLCLAFLGLTFACEPSGALRLPNGQSALCLADKDCANGGRCVSGLCLNASAERSEISSEPKGEGGAEVTGETTLPEGNEPLAEISKEDPSEPTAEPSIEPSGDGGEQGGGEGVNEGGPEISPEGTRPERILACKADEVCADGIDNNCDGQIDEGCDACSTAKPCAMTASCQSDGKCLVKSCQNNADCPDQTICRDDVCVFCDENEPSAACPVGRVCVSGRCLICGDDSHCTNGQICNNQNVCVAPQCTAPTDCVNGLVCISGRCDFCTEDMHCGASQNCVNKACVQGECQTTPDCKGGLICVNSRCQGCTDDAECGAVLCDKSVGRCQILPEEITQGPIKGTRWNDGTYATSCKEYFDGKPGYVASKTDGVYWLKPSGSMAAFATYCLMTEKGGGWTLILKADGSRDTFDYDDSLWTSASIHNVNDVQYDLAEAKLESFSKVPFQSVLAAFSEVKTGSLRTYVEIKKTASSFQSLMQQGRNVVFDATVTRALWSLAVPGAPLQKDCNREGFNVHGNKDLFGNYNSFRVRVGILGSPRDGCTNYGLGARSFIGIGARKFTGNDTTAGSNDVDSFQKAKPRMGYLFVR
ncbi:MAG: hypothetical protein H6727_07520 [Myxococcales bacterium]|nr:hypothetical protein [Myxococcales bacterium]